MQNLMKKNAPGLSRSEEESSDERPGDGTTWGRVVYDNESAFWGELRKLGWLSGRLACDLLKIQRRLFLHWSNGFLMILSLWELQWGVMLMHFARFY